VQTKMRENGHHHPLHHYHHPCHHHHHSLT
jgi:hypothetical protein